MVKVIRRFLSVVVLLTASLICLTVLPAANHIFPQSIYASQKEMKKDVSHNLPSDNFPQDDMWQAPQTSSITNKEQRELVEYGKDLIANTSKYFGPNGTVAKQANVMNCQNCHLDAGTRPMGNNYSAVASTYPKFRARSGTYEGIVKRISDCFNRSLNGKEPDSTGREMKAMVAYMKFLGTGVQKGVRPKGAGIQKLAYLNRAADPLKGAVLYQEKCVLCHGSTGEGKLGPDGKYFIYPPLWGNNSYNDAAGLFRISSFAGYIKNNMPYGATYKNPMLTDEEAWDIAAFVNSKPRPHKDQKDDYKDISKKPIDSPYGPYQDKFSETQHKYGPFGPIVQSATNK